MPTSTGTLTGSTISGSGAYGSVPATTDPTTSAAQAITGNIANLSNIYTMAGGINQFTNQQALQNLASNLPGYTGMSSQSSANIASLLRGEIPSDVRAQMAQSAAERGISGGMGVDTANTNAALLRALGLTSLGLQQTGESELTSAIARTPTGQQYNVSSMLVSPQEQQAAQQAANVYASSPDPTIAALTNQQALDQGTQQGLRSIGGGTTGGGGGGGQSLSSILASLGLGGGGGGGMGSIIGRSMGTELTGTTDPGAYDRWAEAGGLRGSTLGGVGTSGVLGDQYGEGDYGWMYGLAPGEYESVMGGGTGEGSSSGEDFYGYSGEEGF